MVLLTIVTNSNPHTLYFDHPIEKPSYIRLLSASLYNSWNSLKQNATIVYLDLTSNKKNTRTFLPGHYSFVSIAKEMEEAFATLNLKTDINTPLGEMIIHNTFNANIRLSNNLAELLGIRPNLMFMTFVKRLNSPTTYFVHCDLIDKRQNLLNGKPSTVLAKFDIRGQLFKRVHYQTPQRHVLRDTSTGDYYVNSLTISVQDEKGNLFDFNDHPLEFELEIN